MSYMFYNCSLIVTTITIRNSLVSSYNSMFAGVGPSNYGTKITVNYTNATSDLVDQMITTKSSNSNVVNGSLVS